MIGNHKRGSIRGMTDSVEMFGDVFESPRARTARSFAAGKQTDQHHCAES